MLLELMGAAIGVSVVEGSRLVKSAKMDDRALKKYAQAFEKAAGQGQNGIYGQTADERGQEEAGRHGGRDP